MNIDLQSIDDLNAILSINIEKADYEDQFKAELKKYANKVQMKGFRKGKTPLTTIKKMYGQSVLAEVINQKLQTTLSEYITESKLNILGQPIPAEDQAPVDFNANKLGDHEFKFELGIAPEFEIKGVSADDIYDIHDVQLSDELIDEEIGFITKRLGKQDEVDGAIDAKDILTIQAEELDGDKPKENGYATEFTVMVDTMADDYKEAVLKLKKDDTFNFDIYALEKDKNEEYVEKYLLNLKDEDKETKIGKEFTGKISKVQRLVPAEFNQELFDNYFGEGEVSSEEEARAKVKEGIQKHYDEQAKQVMYRNIMDSLLESTKFDLPETFLKKWLKLSNEKATEEEIDKDFGGFLKNLHWTLIKSKLSEQFEVKVDGQEVYQAMEAKVRSYFGQYGMDDQYVAQIMKTMMENREEVNKTYEELQAERVFTKIGETVGQNKQAISHTDFNEFVKELNAKQQAS